MAKQAKYHTNNADGVAKLNFPRLKTAATMRSFLIISSVVAAVFNRGQLKSNSATPSLQFAATSDS
ncbi:MAG: hypothetical protein BHV69_01225 [Bacteroidales bacterium 52_46]|nr:MAG: hypothetical protein BHV69_01225 [Bacteroidales bacterium 52_46]